MPSAEPPAATGAEAVCREPACDAMATTGGYCRLHYIKNWHRIKRKQSVLASGTLKRFIHGLIGRYPEKTIQAIRHDLSSDEALAVAMNDINQITGPEDLDLSPDLSDTDAMDEINTDFHTEEEDKDH